MRLFLAGAVLAMVSTTASASSPDAWARFEREVTQRCIAVSGLGAARASEIVGFDDTLGKVATLVSGRETGRARRGTTTIAVSKLCIYDKHSKRAWVDEASGWAAPAAR